MQFKTLAVDYYRFALVILPPAGTGTHSFLLGVVLLHLLFVPGVAFLTGGARIWQQNLRPRPTQLNQTLLTIG